MSVMRNPSRLRVHTSERILFTKRLSLYLRAGIPILEALDLIQDDARGAQSEIITSLIHDVRHGVPLSQALSIFTRAYHPFHLQLITIGETTGSLPHTLQYLSELITKQSALSRKLTSALIYPAIIALGTVAISSFLILYTFPKISPLFRGLHTQLPFTTRTLIGISTVSSQHPLAIVFTAVFFFVASFYAFRQKNVRRRFDPLLLRVPLISGILTNYCLTRIFYCLALLLRSGVRVDVALSFIGKSISNTAYQQSITAIELSVITGTNLTSALRTFPTLYPSVSAQLIAAGEMTGTLSESAQSVSDLYEQALEEQLQKLTALIEPVLMVSMGFIVGFVALAIISPMYALTQNLSGQ